MWTAFSRKSFSVDSHCAKIVHIRRFPGPCFPAFKLNTEMYFVNFHIQSKCGKIQTRKTSYTGIFHAVSIKKLQRMALEQKEDTTSGKNQIFLYSVLTSIRSLHSQRTYFEIGKKTLVNLGSSRTWRLLLKPQEKNTSDVEDIISEKNPMMQPFKF